MRAGKYMTRRWTSIYDPLVARSCRWRSTRRPSAFAGWSQATVAQFAAGSGLEATWPRHRRLKIVPQLMACQAAIRLSYNRPYVN